MTPPKFLTDLYGDLRDRHLLLPVALLLAGLVAVPVLLKSAPASPPPPPDPSALLADDNATQPAVLTEDVTVRDYRKRLKDFKAKNPFQQPDIALPPTADVTEAQEGLPIDEGGLPTLPDPGVDPGVTPTPTPQAPPTSTEPDEPPKQPKPETRWYGYRIDVAVGRAGAMRTRDGVGSPTLLPNGKKPVVAFVGVSENLKRAVFAVSADVDSSDGDGRCDDPTPGECSFVSLEKGDLQTFEYAPDGRTYKLKVGDIYIKRLKQPEGTKAAAALKAEG
jgi:hypothetical protein